MRTTFRLHRQLAEDCHLLGRLGEAHLLLHRNAAVPWFILVPEVQQEEFLELDDDTQAALLGCCSRLGAFIKRRFGCAKLNFATIGNLVPQLHLHIVMKFRVGQPPFLESLTRFLLLFGVICARIVPNPYYSSHFASIPAIYVQFFRAERG